MYPVGNRDISKTERGWAWMMECRRTKFESDPGPKAWAVICGNQREVLVKRMGKVRSCATCALERQQAGRAKGGRKSPPKPQAPPRAPKIRVTAQNWEAIRAGLEEAARDGRSHRLETYRYYMRSRKDTPRNNIEALDNALMERDE